MGLVVRTQGSEVVGGGVRRGGGGAGAGPFEGSCVLQHVPRGPRVSLRRGEDTLWGVRVWAGAHE